MRWRRITLVVAVGGAADGPGTAIAAWDTAVDVDGRLEERADRAAAVLELEHERCASASRAVAALRADDPTQQQWVTRVGRLGVARDLASVVSTAAADLQQDDGSRTLVIDRVAPLDPNRPALGLDVLSRPEAAPAARSRFAPGSCRRPTGSWRQPWRRATSSSLSSRTSSARRSR